MVELKTKFKINPVKQYKEANEGNDKWS